LTQPALGFPTNVLDDFRVFFQAQLQMSTDLCGIALGPGAFDQSPSGMRVTGLGNRPLPASLGTGVFRGDQAQKLHEFSGGLKACQVANVGHHGNGHDQVDAAPGLERLNYRVQAPRGDLSLPLLFETLQSFGRLLNGMDIFLKDDVLRWCGADHFREPPEVGWAPICPAHVTAILSQQKGFETQVQGVVTSHAEFLPKPHSIKSIWEHGSMLIQRLR
jgi:hypothetical protein